jgi:TonB family protein
MLVNRVIASLIFATALSGTALAQTTDTAATANPPARAHAIIHAARDDIPEAARRAHQSGQVSLDCLVADSGRLTCSVLQDTAPDWGFSDAALHMCTKFRVAARTADGRPTANGHVAFTIDFSPDTATNRVR